MECLKPFSWNVAEPVYIQIDLEVVFSLQENEKVSKWDYTISFLSVFL